MSGRYSPFSSTARSSGWQVISMSVYLFLDLSLVMNTFSKLDTSNKYGECVEYITFDSFASSLILFNICSWADEWRLEAGSSNKNNVSLCRVFLNSVCNTNAKNHLKPSDLLSMLNSRLSVVFIFIEYDLYPLAGNLASFSSVNIISLIFLSLDISFPFFHYFTIYGTPYP